MHLSVFTDKDSLKWFYGPEKFLGLSRNGPLNRKPACYFCFQMYLTITNLMWAKGAMSFSLALNKPNHPHFDDGSIPLFLILQ